LVHPLLAPPVVCGEVGGVVSGIRHDGSCMAVLVWSAQ
jgi:hypothetical protein